jgi:hypothetical protein
MTIHTRERITYKGISARIIQASAKNSAAHTIFFLMKEEPGPFYYIVIFQQTAWRCTCSQAKPCRHELLANAIYLAKYAAGAYPNIPEEDLIAHIEDELRAANQHKLSREAYCNEFGIYQ